jgi:hypothetical protein
LFFLRRSLCRKRGELRSLRCGDYCRDVRAQSAAVNPTELETRDVRRYSGRIARCSGHADGNLRRQVAEYAR